MAQAGAGRWSFEGESVLVTGGSRGIGYGVASGFARAGADLTILADDPKIEEAAGALSGMAGGRQVRGLLCDIADREAVAGAFSGIDRLDVLIANAGIERMTPIDAPGAEAEALFRRIVEVNVLGTYYVAREAVARMGPGSRIVITASVWSKTAVGFFSAYCASKHANLGFMRSLAQELGPRGISVNAVCPGWIRTEPALKSLADEAQRRGLSEEAMAEEILSRQAFPGMLEPTDLIDAYLFLASDAARNITGQSLHVDRGEVMD
ncbi:MAG TPA: SDR family NAD(P)-dependent oxidoreductase [Alphaproteobacteria bacterium]|nr:SDR family NAD(P)-dependent oxidoreductase [Alphaproteobacteria bacterium]